MLPRVREFTVEFGGGLAICRVRFFGGEKQAKPSNFGFSARPLDVNLCAPLFVSWIPDYAFIACFVIASALSVHCILRPISFSQIFPAVIAVVSVFVVNEVFRPVSSHPQPSQSVCAARPA